MLINILHTIQTHSFTHSLTYSLAHSLLTIVNSYIKTKEDIVDKEHVILRILGFNTHDIRTAHSTLYDYFHYLDEITDEAILHSAVAILNDCYLERTSLYFKVEEISVSCLYLAIQGLLMHTNTYLLLTSTSSHLLLLLTQNYLRTYSFIY